MQKYLLGLFICLFQIAAFATTPSKIEAYDIGDAIQIMIMHSCVEGGPQSDYLNKISVHYNDILLYETTYKHQPNPYTVTIFAPNNVTLDNQQHTINVGEKISVVATCSKGNSLTKEITVQNAPGTTSH